MVRRRRVLRQMITVSAIGGLAGCTGNGDRGTEGDGGSDGDSQSTPTGTPTPTDTATPTPTATPEPCQDATFVVDRVVTVDASTIDLVIQNRYQDGGHSEGVALEWVRITRDDGQTFTNELGGYGGPEIEADSSFNVQVQINAGPDSISAVEIRFADLQEISNQGRREANMTETACLNVS